jgi:hypothetical protein
MSLHPLRRQRFLITTRRFSAALSLPVIERSVRAVKPSDAFPPRSAAFPP